MIQNSLAGPCRVNRRCWGRDGPGGASQQTSTRHPSGRSSSTAAVPRARRFTVPRSPETGPS
jgi:hypothetical protein